MSQLQPTVPAEGRKPLRVGIIGHLTRISNKLLQLANSNVEIQSHLQVYHNSVLCILLIQLLATFMCTYRYEAEMVCLLDVKRFNISKYNFWSIFLEFWMRV